MKGVSQAFADGGRALTQPREGGQGRPNAVLTASALGSCLVFASGGVVSVALAAMGRELQLTPFQLQWLVNAELLPLAALTLVAGAAGDRFGQRRLFIIGLALFALAALGSAMAPGWGDLVACRLLAGVGEALILPNGMSILGQAFPSETKAWAVGIWSAVAAVASAAAPAIAGAMLTHGSWRSTLLIPAPVALVALVLAGLWIPPSRPNKAAAIDGGGALLSALGLGGLGWGLTRLTSGGGATTSVLAGLAGALVAIAALVVIERRQGDRAMLPPALFTSRSVVGANLYTALLYGPFTVVLTLFPFVIIRGTHLPTIVAGVVFAPLQGLITVVSPLAGVLCRRLGRRPPLIIGSLMVAAGCALGLRIGGAATYWGDIFPAVLLVAIGMSAALAPLTTLVLTSVAPDRAGAASGVNSAASRVGSLLAVALLGGVLQSGGPRLIEGLHGALLAAAATCLLATVAAFMIEPGPHVDYTPAA